MLYYVTFVHLYAVIIVVTSVMDSVAGISITQPFTLDGSNLTEDEDVFLVAAFS